MANGLAVGLAIVLAALSTPYLAGLTATVPDRDVTRWWLPTRAPTRRLAITGVTAVVLAALAGTATGWSAAWPAYVALSLIGTTLFVIDVELHRLPNRLTATAAVAGAVLLTAAALIDETWSALARVGTAAVVVFALFYVLALISPRGVGLGDVKLAAVLAGYLAWFGWIEVVRGLGAAFVVAGFASITLLVAGRATRKTAIPFGPFLIGAAMLVAALH